MSWQNAMCVPHLFDNWSAYGEFVSNLLMHKLPHISCSSLNRGCYKIVWDCMGPKENFLFISCSLEALPLAPHLLVVSLIFRRNILSVLCAHGAVSSDLIKKSKTSNFVLAFVLKLLYNYRFIPVDNTSPTSSYASISGTRHRVLPLRRGEFLALA